MEMNIMHELDYIPTCLFCNKFMTISYSINPDGEIWMNSALLNKEEIPYWGYDEGGEA